MKKIIKICFIVFFLYFCFNITKIHSLANNQSNDYDDVCLEYARTYGEAEFTLTTNELLYDFCGNSYLLQNLSPKGYIIIDTKTEKFLEGSFNSDNPYIEYANSVKYYLGPFNYFVEINGSIYDIINESYVSNVASLVTFSNTFYSNIENAVENDALQTRSYPSTTDSSGYTVVENHEYFRNLSDLPINNDGRCGYVALAIILGYLDTFYNGNTIPNEDISSTTVNEESFL